MPKEIVDIATVLGFPLAAALTWFFSYHLPRRNERREYGIKLEIIFREMEIHGYRVFSEKFELIRQYATLAREISAKKLLPKNKAEILTGDSTKMVHVAHSIDIEDSQKTRSVSVYLGRLWPIVEELKK